MPDADLSNISIAVYPTEHVSITLIYEEEISLVIKKVHPFQAAGSNGICYFALDMP
jgi:hypothetical protein